MIAPIEFVVWQGTAVVYDLENDVLSLRVLRDPEPQYWTPHKANPNLLVGYIPSEHYVHLHYSDEATLEAYARPVAVKLLRASAEPEWSPEHVAELSRGGPNHWDEAPDRDMIRRLLEGRAALKAWLVWPRREDTR